MIQCLGSNNSFRYNIAFPPLSTQVQNVGWSFQYEAINVGSRQANHFRSENNLFFRKT